MTTKMATEYRFTAPIIGQGQTEKGTDYITLGWKLPGSQYNFQVYGKAIESLADFKMHDTVTTVITQGRLKEGKDGSYSTHYYWDITSVEAASDAPQDDEEVGPEEFSKVALQTPEPEAPVRKQPQREEPPPLPQALGACQNHAMAFIESGIIPIPEGRDPINFLWELRDRVYRNVNQKPYQPEGFCYQHQALFDHTEKGKRGAKYHAVENGYCVQGFGFVAKKETP